VAFLNIVMEEWRGVKERKREEREYLFLSGV
jgi:hypothetical protein